MYVTKDTKFTEQPIEDIHRHIVPHTHREYPRHMHKAGGVSIIVGQDPDAGDRERAAALKAGYFLTPDEAEAAAAAAAVSGDAPAAPAKGKGKGKADADDPK